MNAATFITGTARRRRRPAAASTDRSRWNPCGRYGISIKFEGRAVTLPGRQRKTIAMKVLYLTERTPDYLSDDLLYGLRRLLGADVVDYPRKDVLYRSSPL